MLRPGCPTGSHRSCRNNFELTRDLCDSAPMPPETTGRKSPRLPGYNYSTAGYYFATMRTTPWAPALSHVSEDGTHLTALGSLVQQAWDDLPSRFPSCSTDVFSVQPDHVHGIIVLHEIESSNVNTGAITLSAIVRAFKSISAQVVNRHTGNEGRPVWQRGFYKRVIRNEQELLNTRQYVAFNELKNMQQRGRR